jgi:hypothetical protein
MHASVLSALRNRGKGCGCLEDMSAMTTVALPKSNGQ